MDLIITSLEIDGESRVKEEKYGYSYIPAYNHTFSIFSEIRFFVEENKHIIIRAKWKNIIPFSGYIRAKTSPFPEFEDTKYFSDISEKFQVWTKYPDVWSEIFADSFLSTKLLDSAENISYILLNRVDVEIAIFDSSVFMIILEIVSLIGKVLFDPSLDFDTFEVETLRCYNCDDPFDPLEEECDNCGAIRPRCIVCFLDLKPSERDSVLKLPCCGVYAHWEHIVSWLKEKPNCPNCKENLGDWLNLIT